MTYQSKFRKKVLRVALSAAIVGGALVPSISAAEVKGFTDVAEGKYYTTAINALSEKGFVKGLGNGLFEPGSDMTKAQVVKIIALAKGLDVEDVKQPNFPDVKKGEWFYEFVAAAAEAGIVLGNDKGEFEPNKTINRAEMASLLVKAFDLDGKDTEVKFTDAKSGEWFYEEVQALVASGITKGTTATTFGPKDSLLRGQGAEFVYRAINHGINQLIFDINHIQGEGNLVEKFAKLGHDKFDMLTDVKKIEVAKLFILSKGNAEYKDTAEIKASIEKAITTYEALLAPVNAATDATEMKTALAEIGKLFKIEVSERMAELVFNAKPEAGFASVTAIIEVLEAQFVVDVNIIEGEGNLAEQFAQRGYTNFVALTEAGKTEVAKLFLVSKGETEFKNVAEIEAALEKAIVDYKTLLEAVNKSTDDATLKTALEEIGKLFEVPVTGEMVAKVKAAKTDDGFTSVSAIIDVLKA